MQKIFRSVFCLARRSNKIFKMSSEEDNITYSHTRLSSTINGKKGDHLEKAIFDYLKEIRYPPVQDFKKGLEWFNTSEPLTFTDHLKGKIVLLDFFTYCCINCMHILPDLSEIEEEFTIEDGLVVIGVHSAKFENEKNSSNILSAVQRYNIKHPVVNDKTMDMWRKCDVHCWPTLVLLGPYANPIVMLTGEGHKDELKVFIKHALKYYNDIDLISPHKLPLKSAYHLLPDTKGPLLFPGKIAHFTSDNVDYLGISDSGNNRILIVGSDGQIVRQIGSGKAGFKDGTIEKAEFNNPQGLVFRKKDVIYVADTDNHAIRAVNLADNTVSTIVGTGYQGHERKGGKKGPEQPISSPWDLVLYEFKGDETVKPVLIIAMAGTHQIWAYFFEDTVWWKKVQYKAGTCIAIAGSGREENRNNQYPQSAAFAQPSGMALCSEFNEVYIADSESSSVRRLSLIDGKVTAVVGGDRNPHNLFAFGDSDGSLFDAKLQHALGLAIAKDGNLFVADTYNHKIKKIDTRKNSVATLKFPANDKTSLFKEPAGLTFDIKKNKLYIADTNNHSIKIVEFNSNYEVQKCIDLNINEEKGKTESDGIKINKEIYKSKEINVSTNACKVILHISVELLKGLKLTDGAPQKWEISLLDSTYSVVPMSGKSVNDIDLVINLPSIDKSTRKDIHVVFDLVTCTDRECLPKNFALSIPIVRSDSGSQSSFEKLIKIDLDPKSINVL